MNADDARFCEGCGTAFEEKFEEKEVVPQVDGEIVSEGKSFSGDAYSGKHRRRRHTVALIPEMQTTMDQCFRFTNFHG